MKMPEELTPEAEHSVKRAIETFRLGGIVIIVVATDEVVDQNNALTAVGLVQRFPP